MADGIDANKRYSDADLSKWAGYEGSSTVRVMNEIRKDAGYHDYVEFGSDDVTATATKREQEELSPQALALHGAPGVLHIIAAAGEEAAVGAGMVGAGLAIELFATGKEIVAGDELRAAIDRDQMHMAMLANLDLPQGYKNEEMTKLQSKYTDGWKSGAQNMAEKGMFQDKGKMALVQIHADQGANAARRMCDAGLSRAAFATTNPEVARRYATDPAFKRGFDAIVWAKQHGEAEYKQATAALESRDARYTQLHIRVSA
jgi:hypothetical protein